MRKILSLLMALLLVCSIPLSALAIEVDVTYGDVTIGDTTVKHTTAENETKEDAHEGSVTVKGTTDQNTITVNVNTEVTVTLDNVTVDNSSNFGEAGMKVTTGESGKVTVELEGENTLKGGYESAGLQTSNNQGSLEITDTDNDGSLNATGGAYGAGIGGGSDEKGNNITITGGTVTACGSDGGAGIGGGFGENGSNITISGGNVTAYGGAGYGAAGIGGGFLADGTNITISGGQVTANGRDGASGIGGGAEGNGNHITISGGEVTANGAVEFGAGIGGGYCGSASDITITGGTVTATGGDAAAGIGGGCGGHLDPSYSDADNITITGGIVTAIGGDCATGIGGGHDGNGSNIVIEGTVNAATVGSGVTVTEGNAVVSAKGSGEAEDIGSCPRPYDPDTDFEPEPEPDFGGSSPAEPQPRQDSYIIYTVDTNWEEEWDHDNGILTITAMDADTNTVKDNAIFTTWGFGISALMNHYKIKTVRFITANAERELDLAELAKLVVNEGDEFDLVHQGAENTLLLNNVNVEERLLEQKSAGK